MKVKIDNARKKSKCRYVQTEMKRSITEANAANINSIQDYTRLGGKSDSLRTVREIKV